MIVYIAEKPSVGRAVAAVLPKPHQQGDGFITVANGDVHRAPAVGLVVIDPRLVQFISTEILISKNIRALEDDDQSYKRLTNRS